MLQSIIASILVPLLIIAVGLFVFRKASKKEAAGCKKNEVLKDRRQARWVTMIGVTALSVLPFIVRQMWQPGNEIAFYATLIAVSLLLIYLTYFVGEKGLAWSLSDSTYLGMGGVFTIMCFLVSIATAIGLFELSEGKWYQFSAFLSASGLGFVGAARLFKDQGIELKVHITGAIMCALFSQMFVILSGFWYLTVVFALLAFLIARKWGNTVFWFEMAAFAATYVTMGIMTF